MKKQAVHCLGLWELEKGSQKVHTSNPRINQQWGRNVQHYDSGSSALWQILKLSREEILKTFITGKTFFWYQYENHTYCGNHFTMNVSQVIMLDTLNLHNASCQLYLIKTERGGGSKVFKLPIILFYVLLVSREYFHNLEIQLLLSIFLLTSDNQLHLSIFWGCLPQF